LLRLHSVAASGSRSRKTLKAARKDYRGRNPKKLSLENNPGKELGRSLERNNLERNNLERNNPERQPRGRDRRRQQRGRGGMFDRRPLAETDEEAQKAEEKAQQGAPGGEPRQ